MLVFFCGGRLLEGMVTTYFSVFYVLAQRSAQTSVCWLCYQIAQYTDYKKIKKCDLQQ